MSKFLQANADDIAAHAEAAKRLRAAIIEAQARCRAPRLEAVMGRDGMIIADFYGVRPGGRNSRFGFIYGHFDYDEIEKAIDFVEKMQ